MQSFISWHEFLRISFKNRTCDNAFFHSIYRFYIFPKLFTTTSVSSPQKWHQYFNIPKKQRSSSPECTRPIKKHTSSILVFSISPPRNPQVLCPFFPPPHSFPDRTKSLHTSLLCHATNENSNRPHSSLAEYFLFRVSYTHNLTRSRGFARFTAQKCHDSDSQFFTRIQGSQTSFCVQVC